MKASELISRNTSLTENEALQIYGLSGSWKTVRDCAILKDKGMKFKSIYNYLAYGLSVNDMKSALTQVKAVTKQTSINFDKAMDCIEVLSRPPYPVKGKEAGIKLKEIYGLLSD